jgi:hypothetical protein
MAVVDAKKLLVFFHHFVHFFLAVLKHGNPPVRCLGGSSKAPARGAAGSLAAEIQGVG